MNAPVSSVANPMASEEDRIQGVQTTQGLDIENEDDININMGGGITSDSDANEIKVMQAEIERLHQEKIVFAQNTANEILKLNQIIKVLSQQYTTSV